MAKTKPKDIVLPKGMPIFVNTKYKPLPKFESGCKNC